MRILVLGGTKFVGRHIVEALLSRGHELTLFTRGQTEPLLFPGVARLIGNRLNDVSALEGTEWDAVVDTSAYVRRAVETVGEAIKGDPYYLFISTISVYDSPMAGTTEDGAMLHLDDPTVEVVDKDTYGGLKVLCESAVHDRFKNVCVVRPGIIVGPNDPTDRFTFWVWRLGRPGAVPVPDVSSPCQLIDVRDLGAFVADLVERRTTGVFNAAGPETNFRSVIDEVQRVLDGGVVWLPSERFAAAEVQPWAHLPLVPSFDGAGFGSFQISSERAVSAGLRYRALAETVRDTADWCKDRTAMNVGMTPEQEAAVLAG